MGTKKVGKKAREREMLKDLIADNVPSLSHALR